MRKKKQATLLLKNNQLKTTLLTAASIFLLILVILFFLYLRSYRKLAEQKVIELGQMKQIELTETMLAAEENERNRVAKDLHDGLGSILVGLKINLSAWTKEHNEHSEDPALRGIINQLDGSIVELRGVARNMMPQTLLRFGLEDAIAELCEAAMKTGLDIDFECIDLEKKIPINVQISIYRIIQEILTNVLKHADATEFVLQCSQNGRRFYITAEDNGRGFNPSAIAEGSGSGIVNIQNRVDHLNGKIEVLSVVNKGTVINIELDV